MSERVVAFSTVGTAEDAERIARVLVERRLAACVNVLPKVVSVYRWKGEVERDDEHLLVVKTRADRVEAGLGPAARRVRHDPHHGQDAQDDHHLAGEDDAPAQVRRRPAAEDGSDRDAGARDAADHGIGLPALVALEVAGDQGGHRGQHERGPDAL